MTGFSADNVPFQGHCRWFVRRGAIVDLERGFRTKAQASDWIEEFGIALDWRSGFAFQLKGDDVLIEIVDRDGKPATT